MQEVHGDHPVASVNGAKDRLRSLHVESRLRDIHVQGGEVYYGTPCPRIFLDDKKMAVKSWSLGSRFYGPLVEKVLKLLEKSCSPDVGWGIGWQRERKVGPRRRSGKGNHITLAQNLHDPSIHSPSLPRWPKLGQATAYSLRGTRLLLPKSPLRRWGSEDFLNTWVFFLE